MMRFRKNLLFMFIFIAAAFLLRNDAAAATPIISISESNPPDCYYHMDGQIWVYGKSKYNSEAKEAIRKLNRKFNVFRWTNTKSKSDVILSDKQSRYNYLGVTWPSYGRICLYRKQMNKVSRKKRVVAIAHELCHAAGLAHSSSKKSLMYYRLLGKTQKTWPSGADIKALKKARKRATQRNNNERKAHLNAFLTAENKGYSITFYRRDGNFLVLSFPKRGTTYSSSNTSVLKTYHNGMIQVKKAGTVTLTVKNNGIKHIFHIIIR